MSHLKHFMIVLAFVSCAITVKGQPATFNEVVTNALADFQELTELEEGKESKLYLSLSQASAGETIQHYQVGLNDLQQYTEESTAQELIREIDRVSVPLVGASNEMISTIDLDKSSGDWVVAELGMSDFHASFYEMALSLEGPQTGKRLIRIPSLNLNFIGVDQDGILNMALLDNQQLDGIPRGQLMPAHEVFLLLVPLARDHDGLPR